MNFQEAEQIGSAKKENIVSSLVFNIIIPVVILSQLSAHEFFGPVTALILAILFPLAYGLYDFSFKKKKNFIAILGFASILLTGLIGLMKFPPEMIAVKEAAVPFVIGVVNLVSVGTSYPLIKIFIYNKELMDVERIDKILEEDNKHVDFEKLIARASALLSGSFFFSAALNYIVARIIVTGLPGTVQFNADLGKMALIHLPVIAVPCTLITGLIFWYLLSSVKKLTNLPAKELFSEKLKASLKEDAENI